MAVYCAAKAMKGEREAGLKEARRVLKQASKFKLSCGGIG